MYSPTHPGLKEATEEDTMPHLQVGEYYRGECEYYSEAKRYGFIRSGPYKLFFHRNHVASNDPIPGKGESVTFRYELDEKRRPQALNVQCVTAQSISPPDLREMFDYVYTLMVHYGYRIQGAAPVLILRNSDDERRISLPNCVEKKS